MKMLASHRARTIISDGYEGLVDRFEKAKRRFGEVCNLRVGVKGPSGEGRSLLRQPDKAGWLDIRVRRTFVVQFVDFPLFTPRTMCGLRLKTVIILTDCLNHNKLA
jgi:hypothetical protein